MKKFDVKSLVAGIIIGTMGITTVYAASGIKSAALSNTKITLNGESLPLSKSLISVTMDNEQNESLYIPANELFEKLGYTVNYDGANNTVNLILDKKRSQEIIGDIVTEGNVAMNFTNNANQTNIAESGAFRAENNQTLTINITSNIKGGSVDLFLFDPNGKEQKITIGSANITKEIALEKGVWKYNCSGVFKDGGNIKVLGEIKLNSSKFN
ncbi:stalk domain-containing protein [Lacrimispora sp.]|uniref:stalk domain-containing protein n=1 Tax=Lacrimispora sp. TaxID=2719234 RepID=UPI0032E4DF8D